MRVTDLTPNEYWQTDVIDVELGRAVQQAWQDGVAAARDAHQAETVMTDRRVQMMKGRAQC